MGTTPYEYEQGEYYETGGMQRYYLRSFVPVYSSASVLPRPPLVWASIYHRSTAYKRRGRYSSAGIRLSWIVNLSVRIAARASQVLDRSTQLISLLRLCW